MLAWQASIARSDRLSSSRLCLISQRLCELALGLKNTPGVESHVRVIDPLACERGIFSAEICRIQNRCSLDRCGLSISEAVDTLFGRSSTSQCQQRSGMPFSRGTTRRTKQSDDRCLPFCRNEAPRNSVVSIMPPLLAGLSANHVVVGARPLSCREPVLPVMFKIAVLAESTKRSPVVLVSLPEVHGACRVAKRDRLACTPERPPARLAHKPSSSPKPANTGCQRRLRPYA